LLALIDICHFLLQLVAYNIKYLSYIYKQTKQVFYNRAICHYKYCFHAVSTSVLIATTRHILLHKRKKLISSFTGGALMNEMRDSSEKPPAIILENTAVKWKRRHSFIFIARPWREIYELVHLIHTYCIYANLYSCVCARAKGSIMWLPIGSSCSKTVILLTSLAKIVPSMQHSVLSVWYTVSQ